MRRAILLSLIAAIVGTASPAGARRAPLAPPAPVAEGQHAEAPVVPGGLPYLLFIPAGYNASTSERWPLLIFLHGSGERGTNLDLIKNHGPPQIADHDPAFPFVVISPQLPAAANEDDLWPIPALDALADHALRTLRIDPSRVYVTGLSLGGMASWAWAAAEPQRFAAIAPVSADADVRTACSLKDTPIWDFHGDRDDVLDPKGDFAMVEAVRACGGHPRLTIYPDTGHSAWEGAYADPALWLWLLEQRRPNRIAR
jgi:predicted peptidase